MYVVRDLAECWEECPSAEDSDIVPAHAYDLERQRGDANFLHSMGIRFPGESEGA